MIGYLGDYKRPPLKVDKVCNSAMDNIVGVNGNVPRLNSRSPAAEPPAKSTIVVGRTYAAWRSTYEVQAINGPSVLLKRADGAICLYALSDFIQRVAESEQ